MIDENGKETLHHTTSKYPPYVQDNDIPSIQKYNKNSKTKQKRRIGGLDVEDTSEGVKRMRYPEVRGLRFSKEDSMFLDRDREAALTISRLRCMELMGLPCPYPFDRRFKVN